MTRYYCYWTGEVRTLAGGTEGYRDGIGRQAQFFHPTGLTFDHRRKIVYVTDQVSILVCFGRSLTWFHWFERLIFLLNLWENEANFWQTEKNVPKLSKLIRRPLKKKNHICGVWYTNYHIQQQRTHLRFLFVFYFSAAELFSIFHSFHILFIHFVFQYNHMVRSITGVGSTIVNPNKSGKNWLQFTHLCQCKVLIPTRLVLSRLKEERLDQWGKATCTKSLKEKRRI